MKRNQENQSVWRDSMSRMDKAAIIEVLSGTIEIKNSYERWYREHQNRNYALQAIVDDAIRELERILETGRTLGTKEIVQNYKDILAVTKTENLK